MNIEKFLNIKEAIYYDSRCVISRDESRLVSIFREDERPSKNQREWMDTILYRTASKEYGHTNFVIREGNSERYSLIAVEKKH